MTGALVTLGGAAIGLALLVHRLTLWWPGTKMLRTWQGWASLLPLVGGWCYGALLLMCAGGIVRVLTDWTVWGASTAGDLALVYGVGGQSGDVIQRQDAQLLTNPGHMAVLVLTAVVVALFKRKKMDTKAVGTGIVSGLLLGLTTGVLGKAAVPLASAVNFAGSWVSTTTLGA